MTASFRDAPVRLSLAARTSRPGWTGRAGGVLDPELAAAARAEMRSWTDYRRTPIHALPGLAGRLGVAEAWCKDESGRFGIGSFKALGGAYAVLRALQAEIGARRGGGGPSAADLASGRSPEAGSITTITASAGNHGRSVAWGSERFGCRCVVVLPEGTAPARAEAIESHGAAVVWHPADYDSAVGFAEDEAARHGWLVVSDTAYDGYEEIPRRVAEGYTLLADELLDSLRDEGADPPTHVFVQAGVGGLATGVCGHLWHRLRAARPAFVAVEPLSADCFGRSIRAGERRSVGGPFPTRMGGLASGVPSPLAWRLLRDCLDAGVAIPDRASDLAARALASGELGATIDAGPSGAAGAGALLALAELPGARGMLGLGPASRVALLVTERAF